MPTNVNVTDLKINKLTSAQYNTAVQGGVIGENELSIITDEEVGQIIQVDTLPTAAASEEGNIYQFVGTTDGNYTNGYFYKCVSDGQNPATYSWTQTNVQPTPSGLPDQTGNAGKFLTTDGTNASWGKRIPTLELKDAYVWNGGYLTIYGNGNNRIEFVSNNNTGTQGVIYAMSGGGLQFVISNADYRWYSSSFVSANANVTLGSSTYKWASLYATKINNGSDITVPNTAGTMVVADYTGATQGQALVLNAQGNPVWGTIESLPSQTGQSGKFLTTDGTDASWATVNALTNISTSNSSIMIETSTITQSNYNAVGIGKNDVRVGPDSVAIGYSSYTSDSGVAIGSSAKAQGSNSVAVGESALIGANNYWAIAIGSRAKATQTSSIQIGYGTNNEANTLSIGLSASNNYKLLNSDGTIPTDRFTTTPVADGEYIPTLSISSGVATRSWAAPYSGPTIPQTMPTLTVAGWSSNTQTVTVQGVTSTNTVFVSPAPASAEDYAAAGIICNAQGPDTLSFTCTTTPTNDITVNVVIL